MRTAELVDVQILDEDLCPRYCGLVVRGVKIGPSPEWLRKRIEAMGLNPINNVVDVTNYVLFATGQPIHAFDLAKVAGGRDRRPPGQEGRDAPDASTAATSPWRPTCSSSPTRRRPSAVAGVIGGQDSGVIGRDPRRLHRERLLRSRSRSAGRAKALDVSTDASYRFERGRRRRLRPPGRASWPPRS